MPTKNLDKYSQVKPSIAFPSEKNRRQMFCESRVEVGALLELEFDSSVKRYVTQPDSYSYTRDGHKLRYTPDVLCQGVDGSYWYEEIKNWEGANSKGFEADFLFLNDLFQQEIGYPLRLRVSEAPHNCVWRGNLQFLYRFIGHAFEDLVYQSLTTIRNPETVGEVFQRLGPDKFSLVSIWAALAQGLLEFEPFRKIDLQTKVWGATND
ncbi:hypothetical protein [Marinobacter salarius]|jgi:hypothetical protein|uniref:hypothetical protein n=1 Tax=Marinobacter salarius TaxID=1420917 RepID=UPI0018F114E2|nr:hypothetical protein [Marinobacter salarius]MBJ7302621.1 hypothetical protein [Marinobacter salarius]HIO29548.1 hypothetical protein [Marinobacter salarius]